MTSTRRLTALRAARLFDGTRVVADPTVILDGGHVVAVGTRVPGMAVVELGDVTLLPGLVDPHAHLDYDGGDGGDGGLEGAARAALRRGVTTIRTLGDRDYRSLGLRGRPGLPTIVAAGPPLTGGTEPSEAAVRAAVRERADRGCDVVSVIEGSRLGVRELRAAVEEAHRHGLPLTARTTGTAEALAAGVDGLEPADGADDRAELLAEIVDRRLPVGLSPGMASPRLTAVYRRLVSAGAVVVSGIGSLPQLVALGMSPLEALRSMTSVAARVCGLASRKGRLAPGFDADLVAVAGDPLADPAALHDVRAVYVSGRILP
jgi:imidazolonepropionase-like amidohydrolase